MTFFDRIENTTRGQRAWIVFAMAWLFFYCLFVMALFFGSGNIFAAILTALIVMGFPTAVVVFFVAMISWVRKGIRREPTA